MIVEERDGTTERRVLILCIVSTAFMQKTQGKLDKEPFRSRFSNLVYSAAQEHFQNYHLAIGREIETWYETWAKGSPEKELQVMMERLLSSLSKEYDRASVNGEMSYSLDMASLYFNEVKLEKTQEQIRSKLQKGHVESALEEQQRFTRINLNTPEFTDILKNKEKQRTALEHRQRILVKFSGDAGEFFGDEFSEDSFVAFLAPPKGKKSWFLLDVAWQAMKQGRKVAYFQVGDLTENQILCRFLKRAAYRPLKAGTASIPKSMVITDGVAIVQREARSYETAITGDLSTKAFETACKKYPGEIRLSYHPIETISALGIMGILEEWDRNEWSAQVTVIDYAGNLAPCDRKMGPVDQISQTWAMLRQISEVRKCLVVTAQQSNKEGFSTWVMSRKHFSGSKMILAHVSAFYGLNCTPEEDNNEVIRVNTIVSRNSQFSETQCLYCASALDIGAPMLLTKIPRKS